MIIRGADEAELLRLIEEQMQIYGRRAGRRSYPKHDTSRTLILEGACITAPVARGILQLTSMRFEQSLTFEGHHDGELKLVKGESKKDDRSAKKSKTSYAWECVHVSDVYGDSVAALLAALIKSGSLMWLCLAQKIHLEVDIHEVVMSALIAGPGRAIDTLQIEPNRMTPSMMLEVANGLLRCGSSVPRVHVSSVGEEPAKKMREEYRNIFQRDPAADAAALDTLAASIASHGGVSVIHLYQSDPQDDISFMSKILEKMADLPASKAKMLLKIQINFIPAEIRMKKDDTEQSMGIIGPLLEHLPKLKVLRLDVRFTGIQHATALRKSLNPVTVSWLDILRNHETLQSVEIFDLAIPQSVQDKFDANRLREESPSPKAVRFDLSKNVSRESPDSPAKVGNKPRIISPPRKSSMGNSTESILHSSSSPRLKYRPQLEECVHGTFSQVKRRSYPEREWVEAPTLKREQYSPNRSSTMPSLPSSPSQLPPFDSNFVVYAQSNGALKRKTNYYCAPPPWYYSQFSYYPTMPYPMPPPPPPRNSSDKRHFYEDQMSEPHVPRNYTRQPHNSPTAFGNFRCPPSPIQSPKDEQMLPPMPTPSPISKRRKVQMRAEFPAPPLP